MSFFLKYFLTLFFLSFYCIPTSAHAGHFPDILSKIAPNLFKDKSQQNAPPAGETLQAPFSNGSPSPQGNNQNNSLNDLFYQNQQDIEILDEPHRHSGQVADWLASHISKVLTFKLDDYIDLRENFFTVMDQSAIKEYEQFLQNANILSIMKGNNLELYTYVESPPQLIVDQAMNGHYRWFFEVPVMVSFLPEGMTSYEVSDAKLTERLILEIQVSRVSSTVNDEGLIIDTWAARKNRGQ